MVLHVYEWGDPRGEPLVCLHGVTGYAGVYQRLAEERWCERRVLAFDLRGHGRSGWEPPWAFATHVADLVETMDDLGIEQADWVGHSFGGRLILELAARHPERIRRAVLLDPAIHVLPQIAEWVAESERVDAIFDSPDAYVASRTDAGGLDVARAVADTALHFDPTPDGRVARRASQTAIVSIYGELASEPPPPE